MLPLHLYMGLILLGVPCALGDSIVQSPAVLHLSMGQSGAIDCNFAQADPLWDPFWYRQQRQNGPLHQILHVAKHNTASGVSAPSRFLTVLNWAKKRVSLEVSHPDPEDEGAVYYCAARPAGSGTFAKLIFGAGTILTAKPNISDSSPSVYRLKAAAGSTAQVGPACLVTDFSPADNVTIFLNENTEGKRPTTLVQSGTQWSYGAVEWSDKPNDEQFKCKAKYKEKFYIMQDGTDVVQETCSVTSVNESFKTDEKLNTLSLSVLALKMIFLKSIVFNLLMTLRLWVS